MAAQRKSIIVGLGEMQVTKEQGMVLNVIGLGSCIAVCAHDPVSKVGGIAHIVLPSSDNGRDRTPPKYVDTGIPLLFQKLEKQGAAKSRLVVKLIGGARMLAIPGLDGQGGIGERNVAMAKQVLVKEGISISNTDIGGTYGRTVQLFLDSGETFVKLAGGAAIKL